MHTHKYVVCDWSFCCCLEKKGELFFLGWLGYKRWSKRGFLSILGSILLYMYVCVSKGDND